MTARKAPAAKTAETTDKPADKPGEFDLSNITPVAEKFVTNRAPKPNPLTGFVNGLVVGAEEAQGFDVPKGVKRNTVARFLTRAANERGIGLRKSVTDIDPDRKDADGNPDKFAGGLHFSVKAVAKGDGDAGE